MSSLTPARRQPGTSGQPPILVIEPRRGMFHLPIRELIQSRDVAVMLALRHLQVRYRQAILGASWAVLQPVAAAVVFTVVFRNMVGDTGGLPYLLFAYTGVALWLLFSVLVGEGALSLVNDAPLITKVYFPRALIPLAVAGYALVDHCFALAILVVLLVYYGMVPGWAWLAVPAIGAGVMALGLGVALVLSALTVKYRDFRFVVPFGMQMWLFLTPVFYPLTSLPEPVQAVLRFNPMAGWVQALRAALTGLPLEPLALTWSAATSVLALVFGLVYFHSVESGFADIV